MSVELLAFGPQLRQAVSRASCLGSEQVYVTKKFEKKNLELGINSRETNVSKGQLERKWRKTRRGVRGSEPDPEVVRDGRPGQMPERKASRHHQEPVIGYRVHGF